MPKGKKGHVKAKKVVRVNPHYDGPEDIFREDDRLELSGVETLLAARTEMSTLQGRYRSNLHSALADVFEIACRFQADPDEWIAFCEDEGWDTFNGRGRPKPDDRSNTLQPAIRFAVGMDNDPATSKTASKYWRALQGAFDRGIAPNKVVEYLDDGGGIEKLASAAARNGKKQVVGGEKEDVAHVVLPRDAKTLQLMSLQTGQRAKVFLMITDTDGQQKIEAVIDKIKN